MNRNILHITIAALAALAVFSGAFSSNIEAMNWPSESAVLYRNFGWNDKGRPVLGMVFTGGNEIQAAESGEVIFSRAAGETASRLPSPLGAWTAVDHGDGLVSIYSRYAADSGMLSQVEKQQPVASAGISGWSNREGFYFILYDRKERRWINPSMIITPRREARPPMIYSVNLLNSQGQNVNDMQMRNISQGRYTILVTPVSGIFTDRDPFHALQRIVCSINGAEAGSLNFESVSARDGVLMISRNGLVPVNQIYSNFPAFEAAEVFLNRGQITLEVIVQDISGDSRSAFTRLIVN